MGQRMIRVRYRSSIPQHIQRDLWSNFDNFRGAWIYLAFGGGILLQTITQGGQECLLSFYKHFSFTKQLTYSLLATLHFESGWTKMPLPRNDAMWHCMEKNNGCPIFCPLRTCKREDKLIKVLFSYPLSLQNKVNFINISFIGLQNLKK